MATGAQVIATDVSPSSYQLVFPATASHQGVFRPMPLRQEQYKALSALPFSLV